MYRKIIKNNIGSMLVTVLVMTTFFITSAISIINLGFLRQKLYIQQTAKHQSLHVAEAGVNYYRWLLAHDIDDYFDGGVDPGTGGPYGPYTHSFSENGINGTFTLEITPPPNGSTLVKIKSTGWINDYPNIARTIEVTYGIPSMAEYSFLSNANIWLRDTESVQGELHSNGGVRMDGSNDSLITSARETYTCDASQGCDGASECNSPCTWDGSTCECPGVWGDGPGDSLWNYPVPTVDFNSITMDLALVRADAISDGYYLGPQGKGYHIIFNSDGTFDVYTISKLENSIWQLNDDWDDYEKIAEQINIETLQSSSNPIPANGLIYIEDDVWVEGTVNGRATLIAAKFPDNPSERKNIYIEDNINYLDRDGNNVLGLIAQENIKVPKHAPDSLTIDALMLAQNGHVFRNHYSSQLIRTSIEVYGNIVTNQPWTWSWANASGTVTDGYQNITTIFDAFAAENPPPSYPTTGVYRFIFWEEK